MPDKVLVVDDSALMRRLLRQLLEEAGFDVDVARSGREGVERLLSGEPDVVTLDVNMPEMDGLNALALMMESRPTPVIMVSSLTSQGAQATLEALALGAVDYVTKPGGTISLNIEDVAAELVAKVKAARRARLRSRPLVRARRPASSPAERRPAREASRPVPARRVGHPAGVVVIGVSTGGPRTLEDILPELPGDFPWPVLVAQHMPAQFTAAFARRMDALCALQVIECEGPTPLQAGTVVIAQGGHDMVVNDRLGRLVAQAVPETPSQPWHPCVDVLVDSVMRHVAPQRIAGVLLTGMGFDGAASMARLHRAGGTTVAESADTAVVFGMPKELIDAQGATEVLPCTRVAAWLVQHVRQHALQEA